MVDAGLDVGGVRYERIEPLTTWRLTADVDAQARRARLGRCARAHRARRARSHVQRTHARGRCRRPGEESQGSEPSGASAATSTIVGKGHLEQAGRWTGWIEADGVRHELVDARGNRDKSWGPRRWGGPKMWRWFSINIDDDTHFGGIRIGTDAGDLHRGWVWTEGAHSSIKEWKVASEIADDGVTHTATHVHATDKCGRVHELHADVFRVLTRTGRDPSGLHDRQRRPRTLDVRRPDRLRHRASYLHQLDANSRPVVPIE